MLAMVSYSRRPQSGQITCYLNRTYHVLPTQDRSSLDIWEGEADNFCLFRFARFSAVYLIGIRNAAQLYRTIQCETLPCQDVCLGWSGRDVK